MAAEALTPIDEIGMPLPLAPLPAETSHDASPRDWHHHFHPRKSPLLQDLGGKALREARLQRTNYQLHHLDYHRYYEGPPLPESPQQKFGLTVLSVAGYVPDEAISFQGGEPHIVRLSGAQRRQLWTSKDLRVAMPQHVRRFLAEYTLTQDMDGMNERVIDEFLYTPNKQRRYHLGGVLLDFAIDKAAEPLEPFYRTAWKRGNIRRDSAARVQRVIRTKMNVKRHRIELIDRLSDTLADAA